MTAPISAIDVDEDVRRDARAAVSLTHQEITGISVVVADGGSVALPHRLARVVIDVLEGLSTEATIVTTSLPPELTTTVAAEVLGVSRPTLMKMIARGDVPATKVGTHSRLRRDAVLTLRAERQAARGRAVQELRRAGENFD